jgi:hypothetical protein
MGDHLVCESLTSLKVQVIIRPDRRGPAPTFYVYKTEITSAFLDKLESPSRCSSSGPVEITCSKLRTMNPEKLLRELPEALGLTCE